MLKMLQRPVQSRWDVAVGSMVGYLMAVTTIMLATFAVVLIAAVVMALLGAGAAQ